MNGEELKAKTRAGGIVYGTMLSVARNPRWAATIAGLGLDYVIIDSEHAPRGRSEIADLIAGLGGVDVVPIVRVPIPSSHYITMALDAGAQGILAPYCETPDEVREVVGASKWRPLKGELLRRVVEQGEFPSDASREYLERRNRNGVCIVGIESVPAMEALEEIVAIEGVDAIFVGPNDLSISLGVPDQYDHPEVRGSAPHHHRHLPGAECARPHPPPDRRTLAEVAARRRPLRPPLHGNARHAQRLPRRFQRYPRRRRGDRRGRGGRRGRVERDHLSRRPSDASLRRVYSPHFHGRVIPHA